MQNVTLRHVDLSFRTKEAYKTLRSNIEFCGSDIRVISVTSCIPNEGKSQVSFAIAQSFAEAGRKVLMVDADLRKSVMKEHLTRARVRYGLTNYLVGQCSLDECTCETDQSGMYMILAGPSTPTPSELLSGPKFQELVEESRKRYDYVIIDTPPIGSVIDGAVVGKQCDGTILNIGCAAVSYRFAQDVVDQLKVAGCRILGCVLNKVEMNEGSSYGKYYGKYYMKYYGKYCGKYYGNYEEEQNQNGRS